MPFKPDFNTEVVVILQARTGSTRLPNKVLRCLAGRPMLSHCIQRLKRIGDGYHVIVATSTLNRDYTLEKLAIKEGVLCYRGGEKDVLDRYYHAAKSAGAKFVIRATGDNPLVCPEEAKRVVECITSQKVDYVTGIEEVEGLKLPTGVGVEAFTFKALERSWLEGNKEHHREHVNEYILENPGIFSIVRLSCMPQNSCPELSLTIDTNDDFEFIEEMLSGFIKPTTEITTSEIIKWWRKRIN